MEDTTLKLLKMQQQKFKVMNMNEVVSFRFRPEELSYINKISAQKKVDKTAAARELMDLGWVHYNLIRYKEGKLSLENTAKELHLPLTDLLDLLMEFGIKSPLELEDYLEGLKHI